MLLSQYCNFRNTFLDHFLKHFRIHRHKPDGSTITSRDNIVSNIEYERNTRIPIVIDSSLDAYSPTSPISWYLDILYDPTQLIAESLVNFGTIELPGNLNLKDISHCVPNLPGVGTSAPSISSFPVSLPVFLTDIYFHKAKQHMSVFS